MPVRNTTDTDVVKGGITPDPTWYVYLHENPRANEIVSGQIGGEGYEDRLRREVLCDDGKRRNLWIVTYPEVRLIQQGASAFGYRVSVYCQEYRARRPRLWKDPNIERRRETIRRKSRRGED